MCNRDTTGNSSFVVAKPSTHREKPSLSPSRSVVLSPLLSRDWQLKGDGEGEGMKQWADGISWSCENEGNARQEGEKRLCSPKCRTDRVYFFCY